MSICDIKRKGFAIGRLLNILISICSYSHAEIIHVPDDQPDLSSGIDSASSRDIFLLAPGTYYENVSLSKDMPGLT
jgi:hypothetical protein